MTADEISKFAFNVSHKKANFGNFIRTKELEHQAGGLVDEMEKDERYRNLTFVKPNKVIELLVESNKIKEIDTTLVTGTVTKKILAITDFGDYYVLIINEISALPTAYSVYNAKDLTPINDGLILEDLKQTLSEINGLELKISENTQAKKC